MCEETEFCLYDVAFLEVGVLSPFAAQGGHDEVGVHYLIGRLEHYLATLPILSRALGYNDEHYAYVPLRGTE